MFVYVLVKSQYCCPPPSRISCVPPLRTHPYQHGRHPPRQPSTPWHKTCLSFLVVRQQKSFSAFPCDWTLRPYLVHERNIQKFVIQMDFTMAVYGRSEQKDYSRTADFRDNKVRYRQLQTAAVSAWHVAAGDQHHKREMKSMSSAKTRVQEVEKCGLVVSDKVPHKSWLGDQRVNCLRHEDWS